MGIPSILEEDAEELRAATGLDVELTPDGTQIFVVIKQVPLPPGAFKVKTSDILFVTDQQYRYSALDMFWAEESVLRADGGLPAGGESVETYLGRRWRRFSWHRNGVWNPNRNGLLDHFEFMQARLSMEVAA